MHSPQVIPDEDHEVVYERVAAVDVAKASGVVCMRTPGPGGRYSSKIWECDTRSHTYRVNSQIGGSVGADRRRSSRLVLRACPRPGVRARVLPVRVRSPG